jgi:endonuclease YncB( thermonuclease family)
MSSKPLIEDRYIPESLHKQLCDVTLEDTIPYFVPITGGKVVNVYDGDTIDIVSNELNCPVVNKMFLFRIRIKHIDTPELRTKNKDEKALAKKAKQVMEDLVLNKFVTLEDVLHEKKWGRILAVVKVNGVNVADQMLQLGHARPYEGGHKEEW